MLILLYLIALSPTFSVISLVLTRPKDLKPPFLVSMISPLMFYFHPKDQKISSSSPHPEQKSSRITFLFSLKVIRILIQAPALNNHF
jgi:hypothetical protein